MPSRTPPPDFPLQVPTHLGWADGGHQIGDVYRFPCGVIPQHAIISASHRYWDRPGHFGQLCAGDHLHPYRAGAVTLAAIRRWARRRFSRIGAAPMARLHHFGRGASQGLALGEPLERFDGTPPLA